jgi:hypothetical protein
VRSPHGTEQQQRRALLWYGHREEWSSIRTKVAYTVKRVTSKPSTPQIPARSSVGFIRVSTSHVFSRPTHAVFAPSEASGRTGEGRLV